MVEIENQIFSYNLQKKNYLNRSSQKKRSLKDPYTIWGVSLCDTGVFT